MDPLFLFVLAHLIGDYALQTDRMARNKRSFGFDLIIHCSIYTVTIGFFAGLHELLYQSGIFMKVLPWLAPIFILHFSQDLAKSRFFNNSRQYYYIDQALHLITIYALRIIVGG